MSIDKKTDVIKTKRLVIVPLSDEELRERIETEPDDEMKKALGDMLSGCESNPESRLWYTEWQARLKTTGEVVGSLDFKGAPNEEGEVEIGYGLNEGYCGQGYAAESAKAMINWAFNQPEGPYYIMAETAPDNAASQKLLQKLGFKETGRNGGEGPIFELESPQTSWLAIFMCLGMSIGMMFGTSLGNNSVGMCIGVALGVAIGASMDADSNKKRAERKARRDEKYKTDM